MQVVFIVQLYCIKSFTLPILVIISVKVSIPSIPKYDKLSFISYVWRYCAVPRPKFPPRLSWICDLDHSAGCAVPATLSRSRSQ